jgi:hypothetical protein
MWRSFNMCAFHGTCYGQAVFGFEKTLPGFDQPPPVKCSVFSLLFGAEHTDLLKLL